MNKNPSLYGKHLILRHDVDTDVIAAKKMWQIEYKLGIRSTYYYRLKTMNVPIMKDMNNSGYEISYHYEEVAKIAKERALKNRNEVLSVMPDIQARFRQNVEKIRGITGLSMCTVASHGDFVNRRLGIPNHIILNDKNFRKQVYIELEAYDAQMMDTITSRFSDAGYPRFWKPGNPMEAILQESPIIYVLTHPRHWEANIVANLRDDTERIYEGIIYKLGIPQRLLCGK